MKRIIRLTENDLARIVKRVILEQDSLLKESYDPIEKVYTVEKDNKITSKDNYFLRWPQNVGPGSKIYRYSFQDPDVGKITYPGHDYPIIIKVAGSGKFMFASCTSSTFIYNQSGPVISDLRNADLTRVINQYFCGQGRIDPNRGIPTKTTPVVGPYPIKQPGTKDPGTKDVGCKNKTPYQVFADAKLDWYEERKKWVDSGCNGTKPCVLGDANTNINLRNAFCDGTWNKSKIIKYVPDYEFDDIAPIPSDDLNSPGTKTLDQSKTPDQSKIIPRN